MCPSTVEQHQRLNHARLRSCDESRKHAEPIVRSCRSRPIRSGVSGDSLGKERASRLRRHMYRTASGEIQFKCSTSDTGGSLRSNTCSGPQPE
eukprot:5495480-Amphidinium_carterae.2